VIDVYADALKVLPSPTGFAIVTSGAAVYPLPPLLRTTEETVPAAETTAVAEAATILS
jgi:hypothetical protein